MGIGPSAPPTLDEDGENSEGKANGGNAAASAASDDNSQPYLEANSAEVGESSEEDFQSTVGQGSDSERGRERQSRAGSSNQAKRKFVRRSLMPSAARKAEIIAAVPEETKTALDQKTLQILKNYLESREFEKETLEEEDVVELSVKTCLYANERTRYRQNLLEDSDMADGETFYDKVYKKEEFYALANEFTQTVSYEVQAIGEETNTPISGKTVGWVKRAAGLQRPYDPLDHQQPNSADSDAEYSHFSGEKGPRRLTRGLARTTRVKRREKKLQQESVGLDALTQAIEEIEKERGEPFPRIQHHEYSEEEDYFKDDYDRPRNSKSRPKSHALTAILPADQESFNRIPRGTTQLKITRILVKGKHVKKPTEDEELLDWRRERKRRQNRRYYLERKAAKLAAKNQNGLKSPADLSDEEDAAEDVSPPPVDARDPLDLAFSNWQLKSKGNADKQQQLTPPIKDIEIPETLRNHGIEFRPLQQEEPSLSSEGLPERIDCSARRKHPDNFYETSCQKLVNFLSGQGRYWTRFEFFCSDIDRGWYNFSDFTSDIAQFGVRPTAMLSRSEWSAIRRKIARRPRRFSRTFITSELKKRNRHRSFVRNLQGKADQVNKSGFDIPAPLKAGAKVAAYNKRFRIVHSGVVVSYDRERFGYIINFERKELGQEFCPDIDVASHGPMPLIPANGSDASGVARKQRWTNVGALPHRTLECIRTDPTEMNGTSPTTPIVREINETNGTAHPVNELEVPCLSTREYNNGESERKNLVTLLALVDACVKRKRMILDGIEELRVLEERRNSQNLVTAAPSNRGTDSLRGWLLANLVSTDESLKSAKLHLRTMFGGSSYFNDAESEQERAMDIDPPTVNT